MNGLETGVYYLAILASVLYYLKATSAKIESLEWRQRFMLGVLLGVTFLARNDAVFFIAALLFAHLALGGLAAGGGYRHRFSDCMVAGSTSVLVGIPWLINNLTLFGSIVPVSRLSESHGIRLGQNLPYIPANLFESTFLFAPVPLSMEKMASVIVVSFVAVIASAAGFWLLAGRLTLAIRRSALFALLFTAGIAIYYGIFFGAHYFVPRYLSPLSPFWWLATCVTAYGLFVLLFAGSRFHYVTLAATALLVLCSALFARTDFSAGRTHMHKQVVDGVRKHVPQEQWVGAVQTGTLGFFHERTINLDGKVNLEAMRARIKEGHVLNYVVDSKIDYLADWAGITDWPQSKDSPRFSQAFETVLKDDKLNLGVVRRWQPVYQGPGR